MAKIDSQYYLKELEKQAKQILLLAKNDFGRLSDKQINWKQTPDRWSIGECLEHLNFFARFYLPKIKKAIETQDASKPPPVKYNPGYLGNYFSYMMSPDPDTGKVRKPMKASKESNPSLTEPQKHYSIKVVYEFIDHSEEMLKLIQKANKIKLTKRVPSITNRLLRFKLGDTLRIVLFHNVRHVLQAQRALKKQLEKR